MIRTFIAIPLPERVQTILGDVSRDWSQQIPDRSVRWVKPQLMHITLRFLGDTVVGSIPTLSAALDEITAQRTAFTLRLAHTGCFPNENRPRVIWVGLQGQLDAARALKQEIDKALIPMGWEPEGRSFRPHLTVGRVKDSRRVKGFRWEADIEPLPVPVRSILLIESELRQTGPIYTVRHESLLED